MPTSDELAATLFKQKAERSICMHFTQDELRTLARDAAKQALLEAAKDWRGYYLVVEFLESRAERAGEGK